MLLSFKDRFVNVKFAVNHAALVFYISCDLFKKYIYMFLVLRDCWESISHAGGITRNI